MNITTHIDNSYVRNVQTMLISVTPAEYLVMNG
jgi:hypothetical protein